MLLSFCFALMNSTCLYALAAHIVTKGFPSLTRQQGRERIKLLNSVINTIIAKW